MKLLAAENRSCGFRVGNVPIRCETPESPLVQRQGMQRRLAVVTALSVALYFGAAGKDAAPKPVPLPQSNPLKAEKGKQQNSKPAMALFSEKQLPSIGKAVAIGYYPRGCLQGGVELPITGPTWQVMRVSRNRMGASGTGKIPRTVCAARRRSHRLARHHCRRYGAAARRSPSLRTQKPSSRARRRHLVHADARSCAEPTGTQQYRGQ